MRLQPLRRNIFPTSGTFSYNPTRIVWIAVFLLLLTSALISKRSNRKYEIQFFDTNISDYIDFNELKSDRIDNIIIRTFENRNPPKGLLFQNSDYRELGTFLKRMVAKRRIAEKIDNSSTLWGWMISRNFNWIQQTHLYDQRYIDGKLERIPKYDLFNEAAVQKIVEIYGELAHHALDGILIQDDLIIKYNEGMSIHGNRWFRRETGIPANLQKMIRKGNYYNREWVKIKKKRVIAVLNRIVDRIKAVNPRITVGMNLYYETPLFIDRGELWYAHNLSELLDSRLDLIYLMSYQNQIQREMNTSEKENRALFKRIVEAAYRLAGDRLVVKIQLYDWKSGVRISRRRALAYLKLIPRKVKRICFTPVKRTDLKFVKKIIRKAR